MPKSAASCLAVFACLLCFSAAPVAGQNTGQATPGSSPLISSPPTPDTLPTPIPIQITVTTATAPALTPAAPASGMTAADLKAIAIAVLPNLIGLGTAIWVALFVTRKSEKERLKSQEDTERQRMEFQTEAEMQKQRLELHKLLYAERIIVANKISELFEDVFKVLQSLYKPVGYKLTEADQKARLTELRNARYAAAQYINTRQWLLSRPVLRSDREIFRLVEKAQKTDFQNADSEALKSDYKEIAEAFGQFNEEVSSMMSNDDFAQIIMTERKKVVFIDDLEEPKGDKPNGTEP